MSTLPPSAGARVSITLAGEQFLCGGLTFQDVGTISSEIGLRRIKQAVEAGKGQPPEVQRMLIDGAYAANANIDEQEVFRWAQHDPGGIVFTTWLLLAKHHPDRQFTLDDVATKIAATEDDTQIDNQMRIATASGIDESGNSNGPVNAGQKEQPASSGSTGE